MWAAVRGGVGVACRTGGRQYWPTPWPSAVVASVRGWCTGWRPFPPSAVVAAVGRCPSVAVVAVFVARGGLSAVRWSTGPPWSFRGPWRPVFGPCQWWAVAARGWLVCLPFQYWNRAADQWPPSGWAVVGACYALRAWCGWPCRRCWLAQWVARTDTGGPWSLLAGRTDTAAVGGVVRVRWSLVRGGPCWAVWRPCGPSVVSLYLVALSWPVWALLGAVSLPCAWCPFQFFNERAARGWAVLLVRTGWPCYWLAGRIPCWWSLLVSRQRRPWAVRLSKDQTPAAAVVALLVVWVVVIRPRWCPCYSRPVSASRWLPCGRCAGRP